MKSLEEFQAMLSKSRGSRNPARRTLVDACLEVMYKHTHAPLGMSQAERDQFRCALQAYHAITGKNPLAVPVKNMRRNKAKNSTELSQVRNYLAEREKEMKSDG